MEHNISPHGIAYFNFFNHYKGKIFTEKRRGIRLSKSEVFFAHWGKDVFPECVEREYIITPNKEWERWISENHAL